MSKLSSDIDCWLEYFLENPTGWAQAIASGEWDIYEMDRGNRYPTSIIKDLFILAQEVVEEDNA